MKRRPEDYAAAFTAVLRNTPQHRRGELVRRLIAAVVRRGDQSLLPSIGEIIERAIVREAGGNMISVELARALPKPRLTRMLRRFSKRDRVTITENPSLIAGARITVNGERELDLSLARKLKRMFF